VGRCDSIDGAVDEVAEQEKQTSIRRLTAAWQSSADGYDC
jgi:hypothetical protein